ncbi:hypothetical protein GIB67_010771 [Kingdonia uniflora]|uniref:Uncharacterized protein n=1 Tax=Kingdonia uniflora TaxID=39325 RepID=A0A7J7L8S3_9MAGN|nr:hypothetical protein GIB67_010771 [Kingdonia uniflora]
MLKASAVDYTDVPESITSNKLVRVFLKKKMLKRGSTSGTTGSGEVEGEAKKIRVDPSSELIRTKVAENRPGEEDELKAMEDRARLAARKGVEEKNKVTAHLMKGICLGMEEEKVELEKKVARLKSDLVREGKRLASVKAVQEVEIIELTEESRKNLHEVVVQSDRLGLHLLKMGYSKVEVNDIMEDTYIEEKEDEADGANEDREDQHVNVHFKFLEATQTIDDLTRKIEEKDTKIGKGQKELAETKEETAKLKSQNDALMVKTGERPRKKKGDARVSIVQGDVVCLSARIRELEGNVARTQGHVQKGNERLRECQGNLDVVHVREQELKRVIRGNNILIRKKDKLLKKSPAGGGVDKELEELRALVVELRAMNQAELDKADEKAREHINLMSRADSHMEWHKARYKKL